MNKTKNKFLKIIIIIFIIILFVFSITYDLALATVNFPFLTSFLFIIFMVIRFLRYLFR